ncbi:MAG: hypothetical protein FWB82_00815 [Treponema sp.]|nr:hypothetical protein [Treponema sp.]
MKNPGMKICCDINRPNKELVASFSDVKTALISDASNRMFAMDARISARGKTKRLLGTAVTVRGAVADNMAIHKAMLLAQPGDIIVIDVSGDMNYSVVGSLMYTCAIARGIAGFVVDGCVRYIRDLMEKDFPVYAAGVTPRGHYQGGPGEVNVPVNCGGVVVHPGDIIVGDEDGVVVVRPADAQTILEKVKQIIANEAEMVELIKNGRWEESRIVRNVEANIEKMGFEIVKG